MEHFERGSGEEENISSLIERIGAHHAELLNILENAALNKERHEDSVELVFSGYEQDLSDLKTKALEVFRSQQTKTKEEA